MSRDNSVEKPKAAATDHGTQGIARIGVAMAAILRDAEDAQAILTVTAMLAIDAALAAGIDGPAYAKTFQQMWQDRMRLQPQQRLLMNLMALPEPGSPVGPGSGSNRTPH